MAVQLQTNMGNELTLETKIVESKTNGEQYEIVLPPDGWVGIGQVAEMTGYQAQYVRQLVLKDKVEAVKITRKGFSKWVIDPESVAEYQSRTITRGGKRRWVLRMDLDSEDAAREALDASGVDYSLELQYQPSNDEESEDEAEAEAESDIDFLS